MYKSVLSVFIRGEICLFIQSQRRALFLFGSILCSAFFLQAQNAAPAAAQKGTPATQNAAPPAAQNTPAVPEPGQYPTVPTITYDRLWEAYTPQNINIKVTSTGSTRYLSRNPVKTPDKTEPDSEFQLEFTMSAANREKLFRDAREANYFQGDFTYRKHAVATTGHKTLTYADPSRHFETAYDYTENKPVEEITNIFQGISNTIEHGRKLQYLRRFDKLGLEAELKAMENAGESHTLAELQLLQPILESIANDTAVLNIARQRARRLLGKAHSE